MEAQGVFLRSCRAVTRLSEVCNPFRGGRCWLLKRGANPPPAPPCRRMSGNIDEETKNSTSHGEPHPPPSPP